MPAPLVVLPPGDLDARARAATGASATFLDGLIATGAAVWIGQTDMAAVEVARQLWQDRERARALWEGSPGDKDLFNTYNELTKRLTTCLSQLGLDPAARARLGVAEVHRQSTLDAVEERRAKRRAGRHAG